MASRLSALRAGRTLPPGFFIFKDSSYLFLLEAESTPEPVRPEGLGQFKKKDPPHRDSNPRPSGLVRKRSARPATPGLKFPGTRTLERRAITDPTETNKQSKQSL
jgi:hypothetical protein